MKWLDDIEETAEHFVQGGLTSGELSSVFSVDIPKLLRVARAVEAIADSLRHEVSSQGGPVPRAVVINAIERIRAALQDEGER